MTYDTQRSCHRTTRLVQCQLAKHSKSLFLRYILVTGLRSIHTLRRIRSAWYPAGFGTLDFSSGEPQRRQTQIRCEAALTLAKTRIAASITVMSAMIACSIGAEPQAIDSEQMNANYAAAKQRTSE